MTMKKQAAAAAAAAMSTTAYRPTATVMMITATKTNATREVPPLRVAALMPRGLHRGARSARRVYEPLVVTATAAAATAAAGAAAGAAVAAQVLLSRPSSGRRPLHPTRGTGEQASVQMIWWGWRPAQRGPPHARRGRPATGPARPQQEVRQGVRQGGLQETRAVRAVRAVRVVRAVRATRATRATRAIRAAGGEQKGQKQVLQPPRSRPGAVDISGNGCRAPASEERCARRRCARGSRRGRSCCWAI